MVERRERNFRAAHRFHDRLLEGSSDRHDLARRLHARAEPPLCIQEFVERPLGELNDDIVDRGLEASVSFARDVVFDFVEGVAERDLRRDLCNRIPRCLTCKRGRT